MGCDIHSFAEKKVNGKWERVEEKIFLEGTEPFGWRSYSMFAFLADVRNYDYCTPLSKPKGLPDDSEFLNELSDYDISITHRLYLEGDYDYHSHSYLTLKELLDFDYDQDFWNRRVTKQIGPNSWDGAALAEEGEGEIISYRENLGEGFFKDLETLKTLGDLEEVRIVFYFDN
jgi:hypothetical protein